MADINLSQGYKKKEKSLEREERRRLRFHSWNFGWSSLASKSFQGEHTQQIHVNSCSWLGLLPSEVGAVCELGQLSAC